MFQFTLFRSVNKGFNVFHSLGPIISYLSSIMSPLRAHSIQSVIQLMTARELYELFMDDYRVHNIDWSQESAQLVLEKWQKSFSSEVSMHSRRQETGFAPFVIYRSPRLMSRRSMWSMSHFTGGCNFEADSFRNLIVGFVFQIH